MSELIGQRTETKQTPVVANNTEYIDKQALLDEFERWNFGKHGQLEKHFADRAFAIIDKVPTAPVAPITDTVKKMQELIEERCIKGGIYPAFVARTIDQIAKEILEDNNEHQEETRSLP